MNFDYDIVIIGGAFSGAATALMRVNTLRPTALPAEQCAVPMQNKPTEKHPHYSAECQVRSKR